MPRPYLLPATALAALALAAPASALTVYTDRSAFESAASATVADDFESLTSSVPHPLTRGALTYNVALYESSSYFYRASAGQSTNPTMALGFSWTKDDYFTIDLGGFYTDFGIDIFQNVGGGSQVDVNGVAYSLGFYSSSLGGLVDSYAVGYAQPDGGSFLGASVSTAFDRVTVYGFETSDGTTVDDDIYEVIDNLTLGPVASASAAVPLPAALPLTAAGLAALGAVARRRRG
ncbi:MAG: hypothetical protein VYD87_15695 [Pseudomonadota bacterium]|nr:hypothetical protein [Pseudomonadota bacterium]